MSLLPFLGLAFVCGSIPTAYWTAKRLKNIDIREHGSGNAGATNVMRVLGKGPGCFVFAVDFFKGFLPVIWFKLVNEAPPTELQLLLVGVFAVLGHVFTPWLGFKGGKGVATGAGMLAAALPFYFAVSLAVWFALYWKTKMVSIASLIAAFDLVIIGIAMHQDPGIIAAFAGLFMFVAWTHRSNLARLLQKKENKF